MNFNLCFVIQKIFILISVFKKRLFISVYIRSFFSQSTKNAISYKFSIINNKLNV